MSLCHADLKGVVQTCSGCGQRNRIAFENLATETRCGQCKNTLPALDCAIEVPDEAAFGALVSGSALPVLVDFWADWCGPCKMMGPELERFAVKQAGKIAVAKVNTEGVPAVAARFNISAIPTLILFEGGNEASRAQGARSSNQIASFVADALAVRH